VVECVFRRGGASITRDTLTFVIPDPRISLVFQPVQASGIVSVASFGFDGSVSDALWAVDRTSVATINEDKGTGTAQLQIFAYLAIQGQNAFIVRVNYSVYVRQLPGVLNIDHVCSTLSEQPLCNRLSRVTSIHAVSEDASAAAAI
jgi:hypothetical protein